MTLSEHILEKDSCIICLLTEEEGESSLILNNRCTCKYTYHKECMNSIVICPTCGKSYLLDQHLQQNTNTGESKLGKAIIFIIFVAVLCVAGYYSATAR